MKDQQEIIKQFNRLGFQVEDTGGGCQWLRRQFTDTLSLVITNGEAQLPDWETAQLYVILESDAGSLDIAKGEVMTAQKLLNDLTSGGLRFSRAYCDTPCTTKGCNRRALTRHYDLQTKSVREYCLVCGRDRTGDE